MSDDEPRLRTGFWVQTQLRLCDLAAIPFTVVKRGDADAGAVLLRIDKGMKGVVILAREYDAAGKRSWQPALGDAPVTAEEADAYVARQTGRDPDLWVIEVEDSAGRYKPD
ncbi:MAG TPA: DUF1491 family protein [Alphaproteobacteria bacterium]|jgi:hypothetical protein